jgi:hypothetical protein
MGRLKTSAIRRPKCQFINMFVKNVDSLSNILPNFPKTAAFRNVREVIYAYARCTARLL